MTSWKPPGIFQIPILWMFLLYIPIDSPIWRFPEIGLQKNDGCWGKIPSRNGRFWGTPIYGTHIFPRPRDFLHGEIEITTAWGRSSLLVAKNNFSADRNGTGVPTLLWSQGEHGKIQSHDELTSRVERTSKKTSFLMLIPCIILKSCL